MKRATHDFCPFIDSKDCPGTCSGQCPDGTWIKCPHNIEAEINRNHYYTDGTLPMWGHLTIIGKEIRNQK